MAEQTLGLLTETVLSSASSEIEFTGISQDFRDLQVMIDGTLASGQITCQLNGDTGSNYTTQIIRAYSTTQQAALVSGTSLQINGRDVNSGSELTVISYFLDYSKTNKHKGVISFAGFLDSSSNTATTNTIGGYASTSAITSLKIIGGGNFGVGTRVRIYGVLG